MRHMAKDDREKGSKWWVRHAVVPVIVAVLGIVGTWVAMRKGNTSTTTTTTSAPSTEPSEMPEAVDFYLSTRWRPRDDHEAMIGIGETVLIHWNIKHPKSESYVLKEIDVQGSTVLSDKVGPNGIKEYSTLQTVDCFLQRTDGAVLGSLRINAHY